MKRTVSFKPLPSSATSTIQACKKVLELAILGYASTPSAKPRNLAITLTLEEDPLAGTPSKRLLNFQINTSDILKTFSALFGAALIENSKSFRASSHGIQVRGFISFTGHPTRAHQYVFVNGCYIEQSELGTVVQDIFKKYGILDSEEDEGGRYGVMRGDGVRSAGKILKPVFLLHLTVPSLMQARNGLSVPLIDVQNIQVRCMVRANATIPYLYLTPNYLARDRTVISYEK